MTTRTDPYTPPRTAYSLAEVAQSTGLSERTLRRLRATGQLKAKRIEGRVIVRDRDLQAFLDGLPDA